MIVEMGMFDEDNIKQVKELKRDVGENLTKYEDILTLLESYVSWANRINQQAELADLENIRAQDLQLMKFCQGLNKSDRLYNKLMEMDVPSWARGQDIKKNNSQSMAQKAVLVDSAPKTQDQVMNQVYGSGGSNPRPTSRLPGGQRRFKVLPEVQYLENRERVEDAENA